jgi:hypothetical protein
VHIFRNVSKFKSTLIILTALQIILISSGIGYINYSIKKNSDTVVCIEQEDFNDSPSNTDFIELEEEETVLNSKHWGLISKSNHILLLENIYVQLTFELSHYISEIALPPPRLS